MVRPPAETTDQPWRLRARPGPSVRPRRQPGRALLGLEGARDAIVYVPPSAAAGTPSPLVVLLHGAGSSADAALALLEASADAAGIVLLAPEARAATWDVIAGGFGPDVEHLDRALERVFATCPVDEGRIALGGFSDGASYALSLGVGNGDLFTHLIAFSPGFAAPGGRVGRPAVFASHGVGDAVLPIDRCSRRLVGELRAAGYDVTYHEFDGGHTVPATLAEHAVAWLKGPP